MIGAAISGNVTLPSLGRIIIMWRLSGRPNKIEQPGSVMLVPGATTRTILNMKVTWRPRTRRNFIRRGNFTAVYLTDEEYDQQVGHSVGNGASLLSMAPDEHPMETDTPGVARRQEHLASYPSHER